MVPSTANAVNQLFQRAPPARHPSGPLPLELYYVVRGELGGGTSVGRVGRVGRKERLREPYISSASAGRSDAASREHLAVESEADAKGGQVPAVGVT